jgi:hypothetical protein
VKKMFNDNPKIKEAKRLSTKIQYINNQLSSLSETDLKNKIFEHLQPVTEKINFRAKILMDKLVAVQTETNELVENFRKVCFENLKNLNSNIDNLNDLYIKNNQKISKWNDLMRVPSSNNKHIEKLVSEMEQFNQNDIIETKKKFMDSVFMGKNICFDPPLIDNYDDLITNLYGRLRIQNTDAHDESRTDGNSTVVSISSSVR